MSPADGRVVGAPHRPVITALLRYLRAIAPEATEDVAGETRLQVVAGLVGFRGGEEAFPGVAVHDRSSPGG